MRISLEKRCARRIGRTTLALLAGGLPAQVAAAAMQVTCKASAQIHCSTMSDQASLCIDDVSGGKGRCRWSFQQSHAITDEKT